MFVTCANYHILIVTRSRMHTRNTSTKRFCALLVFSLHRKLSEPVAEPNPATVGHHSYGYLHFRVKLAARPI